LHIGRGFYYGSYKSPRILVWTIGVIILIVMMANNHWPNCEYNFLNNVIIFKMLPFNKARTKAICRIGPHNKEILDIIIFGMLGDFWSDLIPGNKLNSVRFQIEQSIINTAYIHYLTLHFYHLGYCARPIPFLVKKNIENKFNYRLTLFTFTNLTWIHEAFYKKVKGDTIKKIPYFISEYLTPRGLAYWIMDDGSFMKGQGISIATNCFTYKDFKFIALVLTNKFNLKTSVVKTGKLNQWRISIWKRSMPELIKIVSPYFIPEMIYKLKGHSV
jgi:ubiquinol-cytochrome c reductase cytochrome b subunit